MAILRDVPGVEVTVQVAGRDATEYDADDEEQQSFAKDTTGPSVLKYIECVDDAEFAIKIAARPDYNWGYKNHILMFSIYIDGQLIVSGFLLEGLEEHVIDGKMVFYKHLQQWKKQTLKFSAVSTSTYD